MAEKFTDVLTYALSVALALGVVAFAAYKVDKLSRMENPPANLGLNFPPAKRKVIMEEAGEADPLTTQSLGESPGRWRQGRGEMWAGGPLGLRSYTLLTVVDGVAFVAVESVGGKDIVPVTVGARLPGGLRVEAIAWQKGRWVLTAGSLSLEAKPARAP